MATAPAHVEDRLNDAWLQFAEENPCEKPETHQAQQPADAFMGSASGDGGSQQASSSGNLKANEEKVKKKKKPLKVAMEAMIRGLSKYVEEEEEEESSSDEDCHHNVAAWHNVPHP